MLMNEVNVIKLYSKNKLLITIMAQFAAGV